MGEKEYLHFPISPIKTTVRFIYLLRLGDKYKIGTTSNLRNRIKSIDFELIRRGKSKVTVEHYFVSMDGKKREAELHRYFSDKQTHSETSFSKHRVMNKFKEVSRNSEWFDLNKDEVDYFKSFGDE